MSDNESMTAARVVKEAALKARSSAEKKDVSPAERESKKRGGAVSQIISNIAEPLSPPRKAGGRIVSEKTTHDVSPYSTKFLSAKDQLLLAVDQISYQEFKSGLSPSAYRSDARDGRYDYETVFKMGTSGDKDALKALLAKVPRGRAVAFRREGSDRTLVIEMTEADAKEITYSFYEVLPENDSIEMMRARMTLRQAEDEGGKPIPEWEYAVMCRCYDDASPKEGYVKPAYKELQADLRSALAGIGIIPSKLEDDVIRALAEREGKTLREARDAVKR